MIDPEDFEEKPQKVKVQRIKEPSIREREEHEVNHMPYRSWCKFCVSGRGISSHHHVKGIAKDEEGRLPTIGMDYMFLGKKDEKTFPILAVRDSSSQSHVCNMGSSERC